MNRMEQCIRQFQEEDEAAVIAVWHSVGQAAYTYIPTWQALTLGRGSFTILVGKQYVV